MASLANTATLANNEVFDIINCVGLYYEKGVSGNTLETQISNSDFKAGYDTESFERNC